MRKLAIIIAITYLIAAGSIGWILLRASPGQYMQYILGLGIGTYTNDSGMVYISGRQLTCTPNAQPDTYTSRCTITLGANTLTVLARRNEPAHPNELGGQCEAHYAGQVYACEIGLRHVDTPWFAFIDMSPVLSAAQMNALRGQFWLENLPESILLPCILISMILSTIIAALIALLWFWPSHRPRWMVLGVTSIASIVALISSGFLSFMVTRGFWD